MQDTTRYQDELRTAFESLDDGDLVALGAASLTPQMRCLSLELGSWLTRSCRAEFDIRQGHNAEQPALLDVDAFGDGALADAIQAALALSHSVVTTPQATFCNALTTWLTLHCVVRLKCRALAMAN